MIAKDKGFILKRINFRETSIIVSLYTKRFGKISGLLKGFYTNKKEFTSPCNVYSLNEFILYPRTSDIWLISYADVVKEYQELRQDIARNIAASCMVRVIDRISLLHDAHPQVYRLLEHALTSLKKADSEKMLYTFFIKFLTVCGFKPEFNLCIQCQGAYRKRPFFSAARGGLVCDKCKDRFPDAHRISLETSLTIEYIQRNEFPAIGRIHPSRPCIEEITAIVRKFLVYHLETDVFSFAFTENPRHGRFGSQPATKGG